jgi:hypothetical protein
MSKYDFLKNRPDISYEERLRILRIEVTGRHTIIQRFVFRIQHHLEIDFPTNALEHAGWLEAIKSAANDIQEISQILTDFDLPDSIKGVSSKYRYLENHPDISYEQRLWLIRNSVRGRYATLHGCALLLKGYLLLETTEEVHKYEVWIDKIIEAANDIHKLSQILTASHPLGDSPQNSLTTDN